MKRREFIQALTYTSLGGLLLPKAIAAQPNLDRWRDQFKKALDSKPWLINLTGISQSLSTKKLIVKGRIPEALSGQFYRNGPAQHEVAGQRYHHLFDADGMIQRFLIDGRAQTATHIGKFVNTQKRQLDLQHNQISTATFGTALPQMQHTTHVDAINAANISVRHHGGKLMALWEAGSAYEIGPRDLETRGVIAWSQESKGLPFSAHPKIDKDGSMWNFGAIGTFNGLIFYHLSSTGKLLKQHYITLPESRMVHDFMITEHHLIFVLSPFRFNRDLAESNNSVSYLDLHQWDAKQSNWLLIVDKDDLSHYRRFDLPASWSFHFGNAWEDKRWLYFDMCRYDDTSIMTDGLRNIMRGIDNANQSANSVRVSVNTQTGQFKQEILYKHIEFPVYDERFVGQNNRYTLSICNHDHQRLFGANRLVRIDLHQGQHIHYDYPKNEVIEEHIFVPNLQSDKELNGWFIGVSFDFERSISKVNIFTNERFTEGPDAVIELPYVIPAGFHGTFVKH
ncbi:carotenoid oxygenase family protein [Marinomonas sp. 2405UD68-3]|uniref:carotenoid oxygenase family protein n=1 Tax=Marinomonas sp. 2405UD68-3 TaxID=3391835 RepID=UPI0039C90CE3